MTYLSNCEIIYTVFEALPHNGKKTKDKKTPAKPDSSTTAKKTNHENFDTLVEKCKTEK